MLETDDYMDEDVAYLLGLIYARGSFSESGNERVLLIELEYKNLEASTPSSTYNVDDAVAIALSTINSRLYELLGVHVSHNRGEHSAVINIPFPYNTMPWRMLREFTEYRNSYREFVLPHFFFDFDSDIKREFIRGFGDGCGFVRPSNAYFGDRHRVYLQVGNDNWLLPIQVCSILQITFQVPVQNLQWGHPLG